MSGEYADNEADDAEAMDQSTVEIGSRDLKREPIGKGRSQRANAGG